MKMTAKEAKMAKDSLKRANKLDAMDPKGMKCGGKVAGGKGASSGYAKKMACGGKVKAMKKGGKC